MKSIKVTYFGTATVLLEIGGTRILTDPVFGPAGLHDSVMGIPGTYYSKLEDPIIKIEDLLPIDFILLSHDQHIDNLDSEGRRAFSYVKNIYTTRSAAKRIGEKAIGLSDFESLSIKLKNGDYMKITATPCRHGPVLSLPLVGPVVGFLLEWEGQANGSWYITGDTVMFEGITELSKKYRIDTALMHFGSAKMKISNCIHYTFTAMEGLKAAQLLNLNRIIPIHYEGWSHFSESKNDIISCFTKYNWDSKLLWLEPGVEQEISV